MDVNNYESEDLKKCKLIRTLRNISIRNQLQTDLRSKVMELPGLTLHGNLAKIRSCQEHQDYKKYLRETDIELQLNYASVWLSEEKQKKKINFAFVENFTKII